MVEFFFLLFSSKKFSTVFFSPFSEKSKKTKREKKNSRRKKDQTTHPCPPGLLEVPREALGQRRVDHEAHGGLVDAHPEGDRRDDDPDAASSSSSSSSSVSALSSSSSFFFFLAVPPPRLLDRLALLRGHPGVVGRGGHPRLLPQETRRLLGLVAGEAVDYPAAALALRGADVVREGSQRGGLARLRVSAGGLGEDAQGEVWAEEGERELPGGAADAQGGEHVVGDGARGRGRQGRDGDLFLISFGVAGEEKGGGGGKEKKEKEEEGGLTNVSFFFFISFFFFCEKSLRRLQKKKKATHLFSLFFSLSGPPLRTTTTTKNYSRSGTSRPSQRRSPCSRA